MIKLSALQPRLEGLNSRGFLKFVDRRTGLQLITVSASDYTVRQLRKAVATGAFRQSDLSYEMKARELGNKTVIANLQVMYKGEPALWITDTNGKLDPRYIEDVSNRIASAINQAKNDKERLKLLKERAEEFYGVAFSKFPAAIAGELNKKLTNALKRAK
jgi:hypothetical protein